MQGFPNELKLFSADAISISGEEGLCLLDVNRRDFQNAGKQFVVFPKKQYPLLKLDELGLAGDVELALYSKRVTLLRLNPTKARVVHPHFSLYQPALYP